MTIKGISFDLEGTCIDLELFHFEAYSETLAEKGIQMTPQEMWTIPGAIGGGGRFIASAVQLLYPNVDLSDFSDRKKQKYEEKMRTADIVPRGGLVEALNLIASLSIPIALGSRTPRPQGEYLLTKSGLDAYFTDSNSVFGEDVVNQKPAPDVYLKTAEILGITPQEQLIFEDSAVGIKSGVAAGSVVVAVPSPVGSSKEYSETLQDAGAEKVLRSWNEVTKDFLQSL